MARLRVAAGTAKAEHAGLGVADRSAGQESVSVAQRKAVAHLRCMTRLVGPSAKTFRMPRACSLSEWAERRKPQVAPFLEIAKPHSSMGPHSLAHPCGVHPARHPTSTLLTCCCQVCETQRLAADRASTREALGLRALRRIRCSGLGGHIAERWEVASGGRSKAAVEETTGVVDLCTTSVLLHQTMRNIMMGIRVEVGLAMTRILPPDRLTGIHGHDGIVSELIWAGERPAKPGRERCRRKGTRSRNCAEKRSTVSDAVEEGGRRQSDGRREDEAMDKSMGKSITGPRMSLGKLAAGAGHRRN